MASMFARLFIVTPKFHSPLKPSNFRHSTPPPFLISPRTTKFRCAETSISVIRAISSVDVVTKTSAIEPGRAVESESLPSDVRKRAMDAINSSGRRVTTGDVASNTGLNLHEAQKALQALATDTSACLEVSDDGDVLYVFPEDYRLKLAAKSFWIRTEPFLEKGKMATGYLVRASFGTALIASIVLVYATIIAIALFSEKDDNGVGSFCDSLTNVYFRPNGLFRYPRQQVKKGDGEMSFIESIFSFVFGDGDPNHGTEEERWKLIGQYIALHGGVVTAEELAPYLDVETKIMDDDSYILPVLLRFNGQPEIDEEGNILYLFPSLQRTASLQRSGLKEYVRWADRAEGVDKFFKENKWQFSKTNFSARAMVIGLGGFNLLGIVILGSMLNMTTNPDGFISFVSNIFPLLQIYAASFFVIPLIRWLLIQNMNAKIIKRNRAREQRAKALDSPNLSLIRKLLNARDMAQKTFISQDKIVYSTDKDLYEQGYETQEWDRRFEKIESCD
ncbi:hypothetical protein ACJIZ3_021794 [Penstemon smallii]|uniref:Iron-sulfur cluster biosynthesis family protein n=1 Tax=Penstemon smallii TaxID=265156 RepID=A0ABD3SMQ1_9LAMI